MPTIIADYPAYLIVEYDGFNFTDGDVFAVPFESRRHGTLFHFYTLGSIFGFADRNGYRNGRTDAELEAENATKGPEHKVYWANQNSVCISNMVVEKVTRPAVRHGDVIMFRGKRFEVRPTWNDNVNLVEVA